MKRLKLSLMVTALVIGVFGAFATKTSKKLLLTDPTYDWTGSGTKHSGSLINATVATAVDFYGCPPGTNLCATGTLDMGPGPATATLLKQ